jgi:hypothetical protein
VTLSALAVAAPSIDQCTPEQIDSYCKLYTKQIETEKEAEAAIKLPRSLKDKMLLNEKLYRDQCPQAS